MPRWGVFCWGVWPHGAGYGRLDPGWPRGMKPWERDERLSKKGGDSAAADAWNRVARAIALIEPMVMR